MKAEELRIGNLVRIIPIDPTSQGAIRVIKVLNSYVDEVDLMTENGEPRLASIIDIEPIPITEEWLLRFRFIKKPKTNIYLKPMFSIGEKILKLMAVCLDDNSSTIAIVDYYTETEKSDLLHLDYQFIHQLQNLFFALCGEELKIKE